MIIGFYIAPILISKLGTEAYGFIGLSNDFTNYIAIITTLFNSMAARFITLAIAKGDFKKANIYFNSILATNVLLSSLFCIFTIIIVLNINKFINIPTKFIIDVKLTFLFTFITYIVSVLTSIFTISTYIKNRLDIQGARNLIQYLIRLLFIIIFLNALTIKIYLISIATLIATIIIAVFNINITKKLTPEIEIKFKYVKPGAVKELAKSGGWLVFINLSEILMRGLDLLIANLLFGSYQMGLLSVARTFPGYFSLIIGVIAPIFTPGFISLFAVNKTKELIQSTKESIKSMALIMMVPITGFIVFSTNFYTLWLKNYSSEEIRIMAILSTITVIQTYFNSVTATMAQISVVTNKLKLPVILSFFCGLINLITVIILVKTTNLGVYAIVLSSTVIICLRYVLFNSYYCSRLLGQNTITFLLPVIKIWLTIPVLFIIMLLYKHYIVIDSWIDLIIAAIICGICGYMIEFVLLDRNYTIKKLEEIKCKILSKGKNE